VFPNPDHVPYLKARFTPTLLDELTGPVPYLPGARMPYYRFIGRRSSAG
jgi:S-adenosylmethionine-diacylgycerolhomoserine-N-methlytransferase